MTMEGVSDWNWPGRSRGRSPRFAVTLASSTAFHLIFTPLPLLLGLLSAHLFDRPVDEPLVDEIPIELLGEELVSAPEPKVPQPSEPTQVAEPDASRSPEAPRKTETPPKEREAKPEPKVDRTAPEKQNISEGGLRDPVALAGDAGKIVDSNANVRVLLHTDVVRRETVGPRIAGLLRRTPQWADFFGPARIDPLEDVDRVLIAGPSLRSTENLIAVVSHHLEPERVNAAFGALVERGGEWVRQEPPLARARADRADRVFAAPNSHIVAVAPPSAEKSLSKLKRSISFPKGPEGVAAQLFIQSPSSLLGLFRIKVPSTLKRAHAEARSQPDGGARFDLTIEDESPESASKHAPDLERMIRAATELDFGNLGVLGGFAAMALGKNKQKFVEIVEFRAEGSKIVGQLVLTRPQLMTLLDLVDGLLPPERLDTVSRPAVSPKSADEGTPAQNSLPTEVPDNTIEPVAPAPISPTPKVPDEGLTAPTQKTTPELQPDPPSEPSHDP